MKPMLQDASHGTFSQQGFSLVEMSIVLVIVALLVGGMMLPLATQRDLKLAADASRQLEDVREALIGFLLVNKHLPCPDTNNDGIEETRVSNDCPQAEGNLPFVTLGLGRGDPYGWLYRYRVTNAFSTTNPSLPLGITSTGDMTIITRGDDIATSGTTELKTQVTLATNVPVVVWTVGKNGRGGFSSVNGAAGPAVVAGTDEATNANMASATKITRPPTGNASSCSDAAEASTFCEFDDILVWLPTNTLISRMVAAGRLP